MFTNFTAVAEALEAESLSQIDSGIIENTPKTLPVCYFFEL